MRAAPSLEELQRRLGRADVQQIRLLLRVPPERRIQTMLRMQKVVLNTWFDQLRRSHPDLTNLELCRLVFQRLKQSGQP